MKAKERVKYLEGEIKQILDDALRSQKYNPYVKNKFDGPENLFRSIRFVGKSRRIHKGCYNLFWRERKTNKVQMLKFKAVFESRARFSEIMGTTHGKVVIILNILQCPVCGHIKCNMSTQYKPDGYFQAM